MPENIFSLKVVLRKLRHFVTGNKPPYTRPVRTVV